MYFSTLMKLKGLVYDLNTALTLYVYFKFKLTMNEKRQQLMVINEDNLS